MNRDERENSVVTAILFVVLMAIIYWSFDKQEFLFNGYDENNDLEGWP